MSLWNGLKRRGGCPDKETSFNYKLANKDTFPTVTRKHTVH